MHGVLDIGCVVFQTQNEELFLIKNSEPVQKVHSIQPNLEPHLGRKRRMLLQKTLPQPYVLLFQSMTEISL